MRSSRAAPHSHVVKSSMRVARAWHRRMSSAPQIDVPPSDHPCLTPPWLRCLARPVDTRPSSRIAPESARAALAALRHPLGGRTSVPLASRAQLETRSTGLAQPEHYSDSRGEAHMCRAGILISLRRPRTPPPSTSDLRRAACGVAHRSTSCRTAARVRRYAATNWVSW